MVLRVNPMPNIDGGAFMVGFLCGVGVLSIIGFILLIVLVWMIRRDWN